MASASWPSGHTAPLVELVQILIGLGQELVLDIAASLCVAGDGLELPKEWNHAVCHASPSPLGHLTASLDAGRRSVSPNRTRRELSTGPNTKERLWQLPAGLPSSRYNFGYLAGAIRCCSGPSGGIRQTLSRLIRAARRGVRRVLHRPRLGPAASVEGCEHVLCRPGEPLRDLPVNGHNAPRHIRVGPPGVCPCRAVACCLSGVVLRFDQ